MLVVENKRKAYSKQLAYILQQFADYDADFIFGCEVGGPQQDSLAAVLEFQRTVREGFDPGADWDTAKSYCAFWNKGDTCVTKLSTSIWPAPYDSTVHFVCTTFEVHPGGARQPADEAFYLIVGNLHVPSSRSIRTSRRIVNGCLHCLSLALAQSMLTSPSPECSSAPAI